MTIGSPEFARNYGFWSEAEQEAILRSRVAIAGVGGDGFQLGLKLLRMGVQEFYIADPELFEPENTNRVPGATTSTYGRNKARVFAENALDINPAVKVRVFDEGVNETNVDEFTENATIVFDESELTHLHIGAALARAARRHDIPNILVMNIGFAAQVTAFHPKSKMTFERFMGFADDLALEEVKGKEVSFSRCLPYIPKYGDLRSLRAIQNGAPLPSIAQGVDQASAIGASQAFLHMTHGLGNHRPQPVWAPKIMWMDSYNGASGITRLPQVSHYRHLASALIRNLVGVAPLASYTDEDRSLRSGGATHG